MITGVYDDAVEVVFDEALMTAGPAAGAFWGPIFVAYGF